MIVKKLLRVREDGVELYKIYSDANFKIRQIETGNVYAEAIDVKDAPYTYEETDEKFENETAEQRLKRHKKELEERRAKRLAEIQAKQSE